MGFRASVPEEVSVFKEIQSRLERVLEMIGTDLQGLLAGLCAGMMNANPLL